MLSPSNNDRHEEENPFMIEDPFQDSSYIEPDLDLTGQSTTNHVTTANTSLPPNGNIGTTTATTTTSSSSQAQETSTYTGQDTLDEPVTTTIMRDLNKVAKKLLQVIHPNGDRHVLRDWDLWGPLLLCLTLAIVLSVRAPDNQAVPIFTGVFVLVWIGAAVVTVNAKLLGGAVSFFQSVCVIGYCLFPIVVCAIVATFVDILWVRLPVSIVSFAWSTYASVGFMSESQVNLENRRALAVYPLFLFYFVIAWLVLIS